MRRPSPRVPAFLSWKGAIGRLAFVRGMLATLAVEVVVGAAASAMAAPVSAPTVLALVLFPVQAVVVYRLVVLPMRRGVDMGLPPVVLVPAYLATAYAAHAWDAARGGHLVQVVVQVAFIVALSAWPGRRRARVGMAANDS